MFEGYATVVEGRLTGSGRPNGDLRAAILRRWAQEGKLPSYARLAEDSGTWRGQSMAYLLGSAYLEWLEERAGPGSLRKLWARMTARTVRGFDDAFRGVFGDSPENLYDRFRAELTWRAIEAERQGGPEIEGDLWQDLSWTTGAPALSPDGQRLAIVLRSKDRPARLVVWTTAPDEEAEKRGKSGEEAAQKRDPEDVPAVRTGPLPRKALFTLESHDGHDPTTPRWMPDGQSILFVRYEPDTDGFLHPDLFLWTPESGAVRRLTTQADLRDPDPAPDGRWAVAVRNRDGLSQIVRIDLQTGAVAPLTEPTVDVVYDRPRISPDGRRVAYARHRRGLLAAGGAGTSRQARQAEIAPPAGGTLSSPAWSADGRTLYAVVGLRGFIDLYAFAADGSGAPVPLTRTQGAALAPTPLPDGSGLFFLGLAPDGFDLRRLPLGPPAPRSPPSPPAPELPRELAPAVRPPAPARPRALRPRRGGAGTALRPRAAGAVPAVRLSAASTGGVWEMGVRGGDVLGRLDWLALGSVGRARLAGGRSARRDLARVAGRGGLPPLPRPRAALRRGGRRRRGNRSTSIRQGIELNASRDWQWGGGALDLTARALWDRVEPDPPGTGPRPAPRLAHAPPGVATAAGASGASSRRSALISRPGAPTMPAPGPAGGAPPASASVTATPRLALSWRRDSSRDLSFSFDGYQLGGAETSLLPGRAPGEPHLRAGPAAGHPARHRPRGRAGRAHPRLPARPRLLRAPPRLGLRRAARRLAHPRRPGVPLPPRPPCPCVRLPPFDLRVGVARILDDPLGRIRGVDAVVADHDVAAVGPTPPGRQSSDDHPRVSSSVA